MEGQEIAYGSDGVTANRCAGPSSELHYTVFYPRTPGRHPIVFGIAGTGFGGSARCLTGTGHEIYRRIDPIMQTWAQAGFVAVNIEYHGYLDGLFGNRTYPGAGSWGAVADATVELDVKPAIRFFLSHAPQRYGADPALGISLFGESSGAHNAYMAGVTGIRGYKIAAVVGWSGLPDVTDSGSYTQGIFDNYMQTVPGSDVEHFGDPEHRLQAGSPAQYLANGLNEFISPRNVRLYLSHCRALGITCWERVPNTSAHAAAYAGYVFTHQSGEVSEPQVTAGVTVMQDSILFVRSQLPEA